MLFSVYCLLHLSWVRPIWLLNSNCTVVGYHIFKGPRTLWENLGRNRQKHRGNRYKQIALNSCCEHRRYHGALLCPFQLINLSCATNHQKCYKEFCVQMLNRKNSLWVRFVSVSPLISSSIKSHFTFVCLCLICVLACSSFLSDFLKVCHKVLFSRMLFYTLLTYYNCMFF